MPQTTTTRAVSWLTTLLTLIVTAVSLPTDFSLMILYNKARNSMIVDINSLKRATQTRRRLITSANYRTNHMSLLKYVTT